MKRNSFGRRQRSAKEMIFRFPLSTILLTLLLPIGLTSHSAARPASPNSASPPTAKSDGIVISVGNAADPAMLLPGISVTLIKADGEVIDIGETDRLGEITIPRHRLRPSVCRALLFCSRSFFCGAIVPDRSQIIEYDEYFITLAPLTVR